jgi:Dolichyl-phosphate-mannose-protein mannosyltransferase
MIAVTAVVYGANRRLVVAHGLRAVPLASDDDTLEWRGFIVVPLGGVYTVAGDSDRPSIVYVHGRNAVATALDTGVHSIDVQQIHGRDDTRVALRWSRKGRPFESVPAWMLLADRTSYARAISERATGVTLTFLAIAWYFVLAGVSVKWLARAARWLFTVRRRDVGPAFGSVLSFSLLLNVWGIWWAMPNTRGWGPDEVVPPDVLRAFHAAFSHGWFDKYPPFHYAVLAAADSPILLLSWLGFVDVNATPAHVALVLIGRFVSLAFGAATIVLVYQCGLQMYGRRGALFAALTTALTVPFAYYSKLANLDVPYLFWFTVSLFAYIRMLQRHEERDYLLFAASAALAGCTKDQAWGLYFAMPVAIVAARWLQWRRTGGPAAQIVFDATILRALGVGLATFLVADNVLFNFSGFVTHVTLLRRTPAEFQEFPRSFAGELQMAWSAIREMRYMFGWPLTAIVAIALARGLARPTTTPRLGWLLVPALSYYLTFVGVILFFFDRYLLPIAIVLALYVGWWLEGFLAPGVRARTARRALVAAAFAYTAVYAMTIDYAMTHDSRYEVTRWIRAHARPGELTASLGPLEYAMIADGVPWRSVESVDQIAWLQPAFVVLNADQMPTLPPAVQTMHQALLDGRCGYRLALKVRARALPLPGRHPDLDAAARHGPEFSDISMINPTMEVFERAASR